MEGVDKLLAVGRGYDAQVGNGAQVGQVEQAVVGGAVLADDSRAVDAEHHVLFLQGDIDDELVKGALEEGRVDGNDGQLAAKGKPAGQRHRVFLGNAHVVEACGESRLERGKPGTSVIAAVIATMAGSRRASARSACENTDVNVGLV